MSLPKACWLMVGCLVGLLSACKPFEELAEHPCPSQGTPLTYRDFGAQFLSQHCQGCHGSQSVDRQGAPGDFIFDSLEQVRRHKARIYVRSAGPNDSMPPGPVDPSEAERHALADWLACAAPE